MTEQKDFQMLKDLYRLLEEGVDDYWLTLEEDFGNFSLVNRLREYVGMEVLPEEKLAERQEHWKDYQ